MIYGSEDIIRTNIHRHFGTFTVTLTLNAVTNFFPQDTPAYDGVISNQAWLQMDQQFRRYSHILIT